MTGCAPEPVKPPPPAPVILPASQDQITNATIDILKFDPNAKIGHVAGVRPSDSMASVVGIPLADVKLGDTIVFTDARQAPIANGTVRYLFKPDQEITVETLVVEYEPTVRAPSRGDLAVLLKDKAQ
jgi:hypothetical protein